MPIEIRERTTPQGNAFLHIHITDCETAEDVDAIAARIFPGQSNHGWPMMFSSEGIFTVEADAREKLKDMTIENGGSDIVVAVAQTALLRMVGHLVRSILGFPVQFAESDAAAVAWIDEGCAAKRRAAG